MQGLRLRKGAYHLLSYPGKYHGKVRSVWRWRETRYWMKGVPGNGYAMRLQVLVWAQGSCTSLKSAKQCRDENLLGCSISCFFPRPENVNWAQCACKRLLQDGRCQGSNSIHLLCRLTQYELPIFLNLWLGASQSNLALKIILFHAEGITMVML